MAALTRSGARNASEIVIFTLRTLQLSRFAMLSVLAVGSPTSSSSQRRPRAIEAISVARFSERIGRSFRNSAPSGKSTSRRRVERLPFATAHEGCCRPLVRLFARCFGEVDDQPFRLDLNACDEVINESPIFDRRLGVEMLPKRPDRQRLDLDCSDAAH